MRVMYVISTLERCGPVNVLYGIAKGLRDRAEQAVVTIAAEPRDSRIGDFEALGVPVSCATSTRLQSMLHGGKALERAVSEFHPDVINVHGFRATLLCRRAALPKVVTLHNCIFDDFQTTYGGIQARLMEGLTVAAVRDYDAIVACSESNAETLEERYALSPIPIRNGVDADTFCPPTDTARKNARRSLGIPDGSFAVVATCGCSVRKRTLDVVRAFSDASAHGVVLNILGEGPLYEECLKEAADGSVSLVGNRDDVPLWLSASDCFISMASSEGLPMAALEAASCGLPLVLSNIPPHREIAEILGSGVALVESPVEAWNAIRKMAASGPSQRFAPPTDALSSDRMARDYFELFDSLLEDAL